MYDDVKGAGASLGGSKIGSGLVVWVHLDMVFMLCKNWWRFGGGSDLMGVLAGLQH